MNKISLLLGLTLIAGTANAANLCTKYESSPRFMKAIAEVAKYQNYTTLEFCTLPLVWDVEVQPSRVINNEGEVIPHVRVQQHKEYDSCLYLLNETDYSMTKAYCYSGM